MKILTVKLLLATAFVATRLSAGTVFVQPIQICDNNDNNCANPNFTLYEAETNKIWAQAGINVSFSPFWYLDYTPFLNLYTNQAPTFDDLIQGVLIPNYNPLQIYMFFAHSFSEVGSLGVFYGVTNAIGGNYIIITDAIFPPQYPSPGRIDTIAHELGHSLGIAHSDTNSNTCSGYQSLLMTSGSCRSIPTGISGITSDGITGLDRLTPQEIATAQASVYNTPEPGTVILAASALGMVCFFRRRQKAA